MNANDKPEPLRPDDVIPGDPSTTLWRFCLRNGWKFVPDINGGESLIDVDCVASLLGISKKTLQTDYLTGVPRYGNGLVKLSEVMKQRTANDN